MDIQNLRRFNLRIVILSVINIVMLLLELLCWMFVGFVDLYCTILTMTTILTLIGAILILVKKRLGIYLFFTTFIIESIYSQILGKEKLSFFIISVIMFEIIYGYCIYKNRGMFKGNKTEIK
ncbi:hypothetical protein [Clostridium gasigenes]|uniref:hypothetical protein n=1 Tax=Clostridium gasigenes TaxID=94869 RepID=UPI001C0D6927|nr:hypothetical protein [Clostridium gasigenes]MBU3105749.1 hypothetical protein [Clostridium gasigenes]